MPCAMQACTDQLHHADDPVTLGSLHLWERTKAGPAAACSGTALVGRELMVASQKLSDPCLLRTVMTVLSDLSRYAMQSLTLG